MRCSVHLTHPDFGADPADEALSDGAYGQHWMEVLLIPTYYGVAPPPHL